MLVNWIAKTLTGTPLDCLKTYLIHIRISSYNLHGIKRRTRITKMQLVNLESNKTRTKTGIRTEKSVLKYLISD